jgi:hypothetical protein
MLPPTLFGATPLYESLRKITLEREEEQQNRQQPLMKDEPTHTKFRNEMRHLNDI